MKKAVRILLIALAALLVIVLGYVAYVFIAYHRIPDHQALDVRPGESAGETVRAGDELTVLSWNIGFGAYEDDYNFFMDGGSESWAWSRERLNKNLSGISAELKSANADLYFLQEVDYDSTRTYHVDEREFLYAAQPGYASVYAVNYDSPFLFYPLHQPHGSSRAGLMTLTKLAVSSAERRSLPVEAGVTKLVDLDRCYSVSRVPAEGGRELCLYNLHLSAYSSDGSIADEQLRMLLSDMQAEVERGNYVIGGGDFNKDLLPGGSEAYFGVSADGYTWAQPIPEGTIPDGLSLVVPFDVDHPVATCRTANEPYNEETTFRVTVDGFLVSDNVEAVSADVVDAGYRYSDHNPIYMDFILKAE